MGTAVELNLIALHGFLGEAADWNPVFDAIKNPHLHARALEYTKEEILSPLHVKQDEWGNAFAHWFEKSSLREPVNLVGYSQGGRLALQALQDHPELVRSVMLISSSPGFPADKKIDRDQRRRHDENWAQRFETDAWSEVCHDWSAQPIFQGGARDHVRKESPEARAIAAAALRNWSQADQTDFRPLVQKHASRLSWVVGDQDLKYRGIASELKSLAPELDVQIVANSGHRVIFDNPLTLAGLLDRFFGLQFADRPVNP